MEIPDISPKFDIPSAEKELVIPTLFQDTPAQTVGGFKADATQLSQGRVYIQGSAERILIGAATEPLTGTGIFMGSDQQTTIGYDFRVGNPSGNYMHWDASAATLTIVGTINVTAGGTVGGFDVGADYIRDVANSMGLASTVTGGDDVRGWAGASFANRATAPFRWTEAGAITASNITITGGSIASTALNNSVQRATSNITFTSTDTDTITWSTGTIVTSGGLTYSISTGNTGNMVALTYVYLDIAVSATVLQITTTYSTAVGDGKILVATAQNNTTGGASCIPYLGGSPLINGNTQINASSILVGQLSVSQLSAITADLGSITAGSISVMNGGNTIGFTPAGTNAIFSGPTGSPTFYVTPAGALTASSATITGVLTAQNGSTLFDYQSFTTAGSSTWTKPAAANANSVVEVYVIGGGGGGGSGGRSTGAINWAGAGGSGGGGGSIGFKRFIASSLGATEGYTVGTGGAGGATGSVTDTNGNDGVDGGFSSFGTTVLLIANGGGKGHGGGDTSQSFDATGGVGGVIGNGEFSNAGGDGGASRIDDASGNPGDDSASLSSPRGGGAGGGVNAGGSAKSGGVGGGFVTNYVKAGGAVATIGNSSIGFFYGGTGGGGSTAGTGTVPTGGAGINGSGGGGGGKVTSSGTWGAGGAGGDGVVIVITRF